MPNDFTAYPTFFDVADPELRARNRAAILCNITEDFMDVTTQEVSRKGVSTTARYFDQIPNAEKPKTLVYFEALMKERGYIKQETVH